MPKQLIELNNFSRGLFTESTPLNFPENTVSEISDFDLSLDGSIRRRGGFVEVSEAPGLWNGGTAVKSTDGTKVAVKGNDIYVTDADSTAGTSTTLIEGNPCSEAISILNGFAWFSAGQVSFYSVDNATTSTFDLKVRDQWGVEDNLAVTERPTTLSVLHRYNLYNQGWPHKWIIPGPVTNTLSNATYYHEFGNLSDNGVGGSEDRFPSNADLFSLGQVGSLNEFTPALARNSSISSTEAPKGKFIINVVTRGATRGDAADDYTDNTVNVSGSLPVDLTSIQADEVRMAAYSSRVFYYIPGDNIVPDDRSPSLRNLIFFSKVVRNPEDISILYQQNDPTDPDISDLLPTDGGFIEIPDLDTVVAMKPLGSGLLVITETQAYFITGPDGVFRADDYSITYLGKLNVGKPSSGDTYESRVAVSTGDSVFVFGQGGLYIIGVDERGRPSIVNKSLGTIQRYYENFYNYTNTGIYTYYSPTTDTVRCSCSTSAIGDTELIYDRRLDAFYTYIFPDNFRMEGYLPYDSDSFYYMDGTADATVTTKQKSLSYSKLTDTVTASNGTNSEVDFAPRLLTGVSTFGESGRRKQLDYINCHFERTEDGFTDVGGGELEPTNPSGCLLQARWNFADSSAGGKYTPQQQVYRYPRLYTPTDASDPFDFGERVISTKNKISGSGVALELEFTGEAQKLCTMYGWSYVVNVADFV